MINAMRRGLLLAVLLVTRGLGTPTPLAAQASITFEGKVLAKETGAPVNGAQVTLRNVETNELRNAVAGPSGNVRFLGLFSGRYELTARALGYRPATQTVQLVIGQRAYLTISLESGAAEIASVQVQSTRVKSVEVQRLSVSAPVLKEEIENLPMNARGVMNLAAIAPGVKAYAPQQGRSLPSAGGAPDLRFINLYMDGVEMKSLFNGNLVGIPQTGSPLPQEALEEFRVYTTPYDAEFTRGASYVIAAASRRGTNKWEGSGFGYFQNADFISRTFVQRNLNQVIPDYSRQQLGLNVRGPLVKDKLFLAASYELTSTNNYIDVVPGRPAINPGIWDQFGGSFLAPQKNHTLYNRLTYVPNEKNTWDLMLSTRNLSGEGNFGNRTSAQTGIAQTYWITTGQLRHRWLPATNVANEASLQLVSWSHNEPSLTQSAQLAYPSLTIGGAAGFPLELRETHLRFINRAQITKDDFYGTHLMKAGVEVSMVQGSQYNPINQYGAFTFPTDTSSNPNAGNIGVGFFNPTLRDDARATADGQIIGLYFNDEWRPIPNFAVNVGVRWDAELNTLNNDFTSPWLSDRGGALANIALLQPYLNRGDRENDMNNISPRLSFSWDPRKDNRTFIRGGYGIFFDRTTSFIGFQERLNASWRTYNFVNPGTRDGEVLRQRVISGSASLTPALILVKNRMETPENRQMSIGVGHQFTETFGMNVDYVRQRISHLYTRWNPNWFNTTTRARQLTPNYGDITLWDDFGKATFDGMVLSATYNKPGHRVNVAYTLGFYESEFEGNLAPVHTDLALYDMQPTTGDERHRLVVSSIDNLPFNFRLSSIVTVASPRPYAVTTGTDDNRNNIFTDDFPNGVRTARPANAFDNWYRTVDLRLARELFAQSGRKVELNLEAFNLLNFDNWSAIAGRRTDASGRALTDFGTRTGAFAARQLQAGLRMAF